MNVDQIIAALKNLDKAEAIEVAHDVLRRLDVPHTIWQTGDIDGVIENDFIVSEEEQEQMKNHVLDSEHWAAMSDPTGEHWERLAVATQEAWRVVVLKEEL